MIVRKPLGEMLENLGFVSRDQIKPLAMKELAETVPPVLDDSAPGESATR